MFDVNRVAGLCEAGGVTQRVTVRFSLSGTEDGGIRDHVIPNSNAVNPNPVADLRSPDTFANPAHSTSSGGGSVSPFFR